MPGMGAPSPGVSVGVPPAPPELGWEDLVLPHAGGQRPQGFTVLEDHTCVAPTAFAFHHPTLTSCPKLGPLPGLGRGLP